MEKARLYGEKPYTIVVVHGGPGAAGMMAPMAKHLGQQHGIIEPFQTAASIAGQIAELAQQIQSQTSEKVILIGASWGAMLGLAFAAEHPELIRKLVMVGSGVYEECQARQIEMTRLERMDSVTVQTTHQLMADLNNPENDTEQQNLVFAQLGELFTRIDTFDPIEDVMPKLNVQYDIYQTVWGEAVALRQQGEFLRWGQKVQCPVIAFHGDYDPHPVQGVQGPLSVVVKDFRFILLEKCGHTPWIEKQAQEQFYSQLNDILAEEDRA